MSANMYTRNEKVSGGMAQEVHTPLGDVFVTYHPKDGRVQVSFHATSGKPHVQLVENDKYPAIDVWVRSNPPAIGSEVTQNGRTAEVQDVRFTNGKYHVLLDGTWEEWVER